MNEHPDETLVRQVYAAFSSGDVGGLVELLLPEVVHRYPGANQLSGEHRGRDVVLTFYGRFAELTAGTLRVDPLQVRAEAL
jgi:ketosteroid isomerase-like protein